MIITNINPEKVWEKLWEVRRLFEVYEWNRIKHPSGNFNLGILLNTYRIEGFIGAVNEIIEKKIIYPSMLHISISELNEFYKQLKQVYVI